MCGECPQNRIKGLSLQVRALVIMMLGFWAKGLAALRFKAFGAVIRVCWSWALSVWGLHFGNLGVIVGVQGLRASDLWLSIYFGLRQQPMPTCLPNVATSIPMPGRC